MASYNKVNSFVAALANKVHNLGSDVLKIALTNTAHTSTWTKLSDLTEISYTNLSARTITTTSSLQAAGLYKLILVNLTLTASGSVGPFRYVYIYNDTATNKELIGYWDYGSALTLGNTDQFVVQFDATNGAISIT